MTDASTISAASDIEADRWARRGYRLTHYDGPVLMTAAERSEYLRYGIAPARRDTTAAERAAMSRGEI